MSRGTPEVQDGVLSPGKTPSANAAIAIGTTAWYGWLECNGLFRFACPEGTFTARKERRADSWYWYAYRRQQGRLHTVYMGKSEDLTLIRLTEIAQLMTLECTSARKEGTNQKAQPERILEQDELLTTKLSVPPVRSSLVERQRLMKQLDAGSGSKLILITGPAGFGKTTLLSHWLHSCSLPATWLSLDAGDNDPARFWTYVIAAEDIATLAMRTEGWVAGLHLVSIALKGRQNVSQFVAEFQGNHRYILDYLANEVLQRQPQHIQEFLLQTAILDRLNGSLCDAVTNQKNSQALVEQLEQANLFLIGLDDRRYWYRYHQLFVEFLYEQLCRTFPDILQVLHHRAAQWHICHGLTTEAIRHALAASEFSLAAYLIQKMAQTMLMRREVTTLLGWLVALPDANVQAAPHLSLAYARIPQ